MKTIENIASTSSSRYAVLFDKATKALVDAYKANEIESCPLPAATDEPFDSSLTGEELYAQFLPITSMEEYFKCLGTLYNLTTGKKFAFLLPLDEPRFEINVDTREIQIPKEFAKGVGVQGDVISETILFRINRFVDAKDLYEVNHIYVQWQFGPDNAPTAKGVSEVQFRHIENQDYLVFAWPLTSKVTNNFGNLKFTVRFMDDKDGAVVYSLNTKAATVIINKALNAELDFSDKDYTVDNEAVENLFNNAIKNSTGSSEEDDFQAEIPSFTEGQAFVIGSAANNNRVRAFLKNNAFDGVGYAVCPGSGHISYVWDNPSTETADPEAYHLGARYELAQSNSDVSSKKRYYTKEANAEAYHLVDMTGITKIPAENNTYYEYRAFLTIGDENGSTKSIIGDYVLNAENRVGWAIGSTRRTNQEQIIVFEGPNKFEFSADGDLADGAVYVHKVNDKDTVKLTAEVDLDTIQTQYDLPLVQIEWQKSIVKPAAVKLDPTASNFKAELAKDGDNWKTILITDPQHINSAYSHTLEVNDDLTGDNSLIALLGEHNEDIDAKYEELPGWYRAIITDTVNRDTKVLYTTHCRVTEAPVVPVLNRVCGDENDLSISVDSADEYATLSLNVTNMSDYDSELKSDIDGLKYQWYREDDVPLVDVFANGTTSTKDPDQKPYGGVVPEDGNISVKVKNLPGDTLGAYYCVVHNELNGKSTNADPANDEGKSANFYVRY